jgi:signal transduction histidine kinase
MRMSCLLSSLGHMASPQGIGVPRPPLLQRVTPRQWFAFDICLSLLFFLAGLVTILGQGRRGGLVRDAALHQPHGVALFIALCLATLPLPARRHYPLAVLAVVTCALAAVVVIGQNISDTPIVAFPVFTVAARYERRISIVALCAVGLAFLAALGVGEILRYATSPVMTDQVSSNVVVAVAAWFVGDSVRARRAYVTGLALQAEERQRRELELARSLVAEERLQIARELHDIVAHSLSVIAIQSGVGGHVLDMQPEEARKALAAVESTSRSALEELRRVLGVLRRDDPAEPSLIPTPGLADIDQLLAQCQAAGLTVTYRLSGHLTPMSPSLDLSVYRIIQEALTNVTKHAGTAQATVEITFEDEAVIVTVADNGALHRNGVVLPPKESDGVKAHHGIIGMSERAAMFGGSLTARPRPEGGFEVLARLPLTTATS